MEFIPKEYSAQKGREVIPLSQKLQESELVTHPKVSLGTTLENNQSYRESFEDLMK